MENKKLKTKSVVLGNEYDNDVKAALKKAVLKLGGCISSSNWGVGGSQEIEVIEIDIGGKKLTVESETYIGLTIFGEEELVNQIERLFTIFMKPKKC